MSDRYDGPARVLHWLVVALVAVMFVAGLGMVYLVPDSAPLSHRLYNTHESLGVVILLLMLTRLVHRLRHPPAPLPETVPRIFHHVGHANHLLLYTLLLAQPVIGLLRDNADGFQVVWFELAPIPLLIGKHAALAHVLATVHWYGALLIGLTIAVHIGGALYHALVRRDGVLRRML